MTKIKTPRKIVICDDREDSAKVYKDAIQAVGKLAEADPICLFHKDLTNALEKLNTRADQICASEQKLEDSPFDNADLVFVDYRLEELPGAVAFSPTGENIIGRIRAFAGAKYIISLNVLPDIDFDLKELFGARESTADLAIKLEHIREPALWGKGTGPDGFCPSYWPNLLQASDRRSRQLEQVTLNLDAEVLGFLGFGEFRRSRLPVDALSSLFPRQQEEDPTKSTFYDLFDTAADELSQSVVKKINKELQGDNKNVLLEVVARMCAYKVDRWLRLHILAAQDILVDLPHLIERAPHVLRSDRISDLKAWNDAAAMTSVEELDKVFEKEFADVVKESVFSGWDLWFDRPVFWWSDLAEFDTIVWPEMRDDSELPDYAWSEDISRFVNRDDLRQFQIVQASAYRTRYIKRLNERVYAPLSQLASDDE